MRLIRQQLMISQLTCQEVRISLPFLTQKSKHHNHATYVYKRASWYQVQRLMSILMMFVAEESTEEAEDTKEAGDTEEAEEEQQDRVREEIEEQEDREKVKEEREVQR